MLNDNVLTNYGLLVAFYIPSWQHIYVNHIPFIFSLLVVGIDYTSCNIRPYSAIYLCLSNNGKHFCFAYWVESTIDKHFPWWNKKEEWCIPTWQPVWTIWGKGTCHDSPCSWNNLSFTSYVREFVVTHFVIYFDSEIETSS